MKPAVKFSLVSCVIAIVVFVVLSNRLALPPEPSITEITIQLDGFRPEMKGVLSNSFTVAKSDYGKFLKLFTDSKRTFLPMKWQYLGDAKITTKTKQMIKIELYSTFQERGAFSIRRKYFRTVSEPETLKFLTSYNKTTLGDK